MAASLIFTERSWQFPEAEKELVFSMLVELPDPSKLAGDTTSDITALLKTVKENRTEQAGVFAYPQRGFLA